MPSDLFSCPHYFCSYLATAVCPVITHFPQVTVTWPSLPTCFHTPSSPLQHLTDPIKFSSCQIIPRCLIVSIAFYPVTWNPTFLDDLVLYYWTSCLLCPLLEFSNLLRNTSHLSSSGLCVPCSLEHCSVINSLIVISATSVISMRVETLLLYSDLSQANPTHPTPHVFHSLCWAMLITAWLYMQKHKSCCSVFSTVFLLPLIKKLKEFLKMLTYFFNCCISLITV